MGDTYRSASVPVRGSPATGWYRQNRPSAVDFGRWRSIEGEKRKKNKKRKRRKKKKRRRREKYLLACAPSSPARRRPRPWAMFLPREETERLPARGERSQ
ncbi:hypothetical protein GW17_00043516 [Ensete ventricosum]|nr:hypothetical protein GW17_00043516 [Ensete ventricosum]